MAASTVGGALRDLRWSALGLSLGGVILTVAGTFSASKRPVMGLEASALIPLLLALIASSKARLATVIIGSLLVFQGAANGPKTAYLAVAIVCFLLSALSLLNDRTPPIGAVRPVIFGSGLVLVLVLVSFFVSHDHAINTTAWFRDALTYVLLATLPVVGIDAGRNISRQRLDVVIIAFGLLAAVGFMLDWLNRRGVSALGIGHAVLATATLAAFGFCHALSMTGRALGRRTLGLVLCAVLIGALLIVTGTRTNLVLIAAFLGILGASRKGRIVATRMIGILIPVVLATAAIVPYIAAHAIDNPGFISGRLHAALSVLHGGSDQSLVDREQGYQWAKEAWHLHYWLGTGPGLTFPDGAHSVDSPWLIPAKFGLLGTATLVLFFLTFGWCIHRARLISGYQRIHTTARAWALVLLCFLPFGAWTEDKGAALALTLLMAAVVAYTRDPEILHTRHFLTRERGSG